MIGYKAFDENLQCRGFQFEVGKTYETDKAKEDLRICSDTVFHFCRELYKIESVSDYHISKSRVCEVIAEGDVVTDGDKFGTNKLTILREIPREELDKYNNRNSGNYNSGNYNSGNGNSGSGNSGSGNIGNYNSGNYNSGSYNSGSGNSGSGNSGNCNSGSYNSGNYNSGSGNSGSGNSGSGNSGNWNSGSYNSGYFNTDSPLVRIFNKETNVPLNDIDFPKFLYFDLTVWVSGDTATDEEKEVHKKEINTCGGFLKKLDYKEAWRLAWNKASKQEHLKMLALPNWDNEVFKKISGIDAEAEIANEQE